MHLCQCIDTSMPCCSPCTNTCHLKLHQHILVSTQAYCLAGPADFTPSPALAPLLLPPLALPFAPAPEDGDIPFPVLRYEEELLAGLIMLQDQGTAVESVDQLLALQPQCAMPPELARHFQGDMCVALILATAWSVLF